ncbi:MAG: 50S ribosome-binding GTPase [Gammaproteobacteria bacterium]|nr:50S ribosome-binding GTPase [Gammaproteobacteria bacterium]
MKLARSIRILIAMAVFVLGLAALLLLLTISESLLTIQAHLEASSPWLRGAWWMIAGALSLLVTWLVWRLLSPSRNRAAIRTDSDREPPDAARIESELERATALGADTAAARRELAELAHRRGSGEIHVALFGEISTGKSSLIAALLPDAEAASDVRGGTTRTLHRYRWHSPGGDTLVLTDMPGTGDTSGALDRVAEDEAKRAHIVVFVTDGDLNRAQHVALQELLALKKPLLLALNKSDRYSDAELTLLDRRLRDTIADSEHAELVRVSTAARREVIRIAPDGGETVETRAVAPQIDAFAHALQRLLDNTDSVLDRLRDSATFVLVGQHLERAVAEARRTQADALVDAYAKKAVVGALAAITPGSDLLIQGYLGTQLVKELAALYDTKVRKVDSDLLLHLVQKHAGKAHTLLLAVAGNALKAFPGIGTLAGGALHAVAYGIIFRTLGRALTTTLATRGELHPRQAAKLFEERLGEDLETSARGLARLVVERSDTGGER